MKRSTIVDNLKNKNDFRQTDEYACYMSQVGWRIVKFRDEFSKDLLRYAYLWKVPIIGGNYLSFHRIPPFINIKKLIKFSMENDVFLIKIDFNSKNISSDLKKDLEKYNFTKIDWCNAPTKTKIIFLQKHTYSEIFNNFKPKTRYNIRLANKKDYVTKFLHFSELDNGIIKQFSRLLNDRYRQKGLEPLTLKQLKKFLICFGNKAVLGVALKGSVLLAASLFIESDTSFSYTQNFALEEGKKKFAPTLIIWEAIKYAKKSKKSFFDFEGVKDERNPILTSTWSGFTRFKEGFNGTDFEFELPYQWIKPQKTILDKIKIRIYKKYLKRKVLPSIYPSPVYF